jgi:GR25 family glycosyltransferase involved in LPS biosynthesis
MDKISKIVYINLERRQDRRQEIEQEIQTYGLSGERFNAIQKQPGIVGCGLSHLNVLQKAQEAGWENVLILEDDFQFLVPKETLNQQLQAFWDLAIPWDVLMLSYNLTASTPYNDLIGRVTEAQTASGYLVNRNFYPKLIDTLNQAIPLLESTGKHCEYANDQCWKQLQPASQWFYFMTRMGKQRGSFSDNSNEYMDYGV